MLRNRAVFASTLLAVSLAASTAYATNLMSMAGLLFDIQDGGGGAFSTDGDLSNGSIDAYDGCYYLDVGGTRYQQDFSMPMMPPTSSVSGRQTDLVPVDVGMGLTAERHIYVPSTGPSYARYIDVVTNTTGADVSVDMTISGNLGSDFGTVLMATSSGDMVLTTADLWFATDDTDSSGDPSLAHVVQGDGALVPASSITQMMDNIAYTFPVTVPAGGRVAIMTFAVQENNQATAQATAAYIEGLPDDVLLGADDWLGDIVNWSLGAAGACMGTPEGGACSSRSGVAGQCHAGRCCTGCWDGTACRAGRTTTACGEGGGACIRCADGPFCSSATCSAGACMGSPCDDGQTCTTDTCNESARSCGHSVTSGCIIGGECVTEGMRHPVYPCQVCDSSRDMSDWSAVTVGTSCGAARCTMGRVYEGGTCTAAGTCMSPTVMICDSQTCASDGVSCEPPCTATSCPTGERCGPQMHCIAATPVGGSCTTDPECGSGGHCVDGVCCENACTGTCQQCNLPGSEGMCKPVPAGTDPFMECSAGTMCNGHGMCAAPGDAGPGTDGGPRADAGPVADAGAFDAGPGFDAGPVPMSTHSCNCSAAGAGRTGGSLALLGLALLGAVLRRRRRAC